MNDKPASESPEVVTSKGIGYSALLGFFALSDRFEGVDLQSRRGWCSVWNPASKWRARLVVNKNERGKYRIEEWGASAEEAAQKVVTRVKTIDFCSA